VDQEVVVKTTGFFSCQSLERIKISSEGVA